MQPSLKLEPVLKVALVLVFCVQVIAASSSKKSINHDSPVRLKSLSTVFIPSSYHPSETYEYMTDAAEQCAFDNEAPFLYVVGRNLIHVIDASDPHDPRLVHHVTVVANADMGELTDIATCGPWVAAAFDVQRKINTFDGKVFVYSRYDGVGMKLLHTIVVGSLPDMLTWSSNCQQLFVVLEGEMTLLPNGDVVDPEGEIALISFPDTPRNSYAMKKINFKKFNSRADEYIKKGVRWVFRGENLNISNTFSQSLEPEYITFNRDETMAYICLQESNAIAVMDVAMAEIVEIYPLGFKSWLSLDPADDKDTKPMKMPPVKSLFQPDAIQHVRLGGEDYLLTADEGEPLSLEDSVFPFSWEEARQGKELLELNFLDDAVQATTRAMLSDDNKLGRLEFSTISGINPISGKISQLVSFGGRGFSLFRTSDMKLIYSSGDSLERALAREYPVIYNSDPEEDDKTPIETFDKRSDNKGPEPDTIAAMTYKDKQLILVGAEKPGVVAIYSFTNATLPDFRFESIHYNGPLENASSKTWKQLYEERQVGDLGVEDIQILEASRSPTRNPLVAVASAFSGTVSFYDIIGGEKVFNSDEL